MKRFLKRALIGVLGLVTLAATAVVAIAQLRWDRTFEAPAPDAALVASTDPEVIARGRYLAYGPAHCASCHTPVEDHPRLDAGEEVPMRGGFEWTFALGTFRSRNITPDSATGIGTRTDAELVRMLRHGIRADRRAALPFMEFQELSDEDLIAVISFLRSQEPVRNLVADHSPTLMGKAMLATLIAPSARGTTPPARGPAEAPTLERGAYLVNSVANCAGCHTERNMMDGSYAAPRMSGGTPMPADGAPDILLTPPNLTPDASTGHIVNWTEDQFVARFRQGKVVQGTHMPWGPYSRMSDDDLRAIFRYLRSLEPVENDPGPIMRRKES